MTEKTERAESPADTATRVLRKGLREDHFLDISIAPMYTKQVKDKNKPKQVTNDGFDGRSYTYAILETDGDKYRSVDNGHKPWPNFPTYEEAEADAIAVCLAYLEKKGTIAKVEAETKPEETLKITK